jgi:hypothetical protein
VLFWAKILLARRKHAKKSPRGVSPRGLFCL